LAKAIAVVDDEVDLVNLFAEALQINGYDVCTFTDPLEALSHIENNPNKYCLIISDFKMPNMNGNDLCLKLKELNHDLKVILTSAYADVQYTEAFQFIRKPIPLSHLLEIVKENLTLSQMPIQKI